jgi:hypothetical protein
MICTFLKHRSNFAQRFLSTHSIISTDLLKLLPVICHLRFSIVPGLVTVISHYYMEM